MTQIAEHSPVVVPYEQMPGRVRFTRTQFETIEEAGVLQGRYELIDGEILSKMPVNPPHCITLVALCAWLSSLFGILFVRSQSPIDVGDADPEHNDPLPDAAVTIAPNSAYGKRHPGPADLLLVCEVSDSTARMDRTAKAALYALAGIREYWILDIPLRQLVIHRQPAGTGYTQIIVCGEEDRASTLARPEAAVRVADLLPPVDAD